MNLLRLISNWGGLVLDPDAKAFITAAGITDYTQKKAVNQLVLDLKANSLWAKMTAIYPFVGGTQSSCSYNLINPAQYTLTFTLGTSTFTTSGWKGNGTGYADTGVNPYTLGFNVNNIHVSYYINTADQTQAGNQGIQMNACTSGNTWWLTACTNFAGSLGLLAATNGTPYFANYAGNGVGLYTATASGGTVYGLKNTTTVVSNAVASGSYPSTLSNLYLNCRAIFFDNVTQSRYAFASVGTGLSTSEVSTLYTIVQAYQTTLGRQV